MEIIEAYACIDHIHMLVKIPPKLSVSQFMGYLKGKSSLMIFENHANLKYKYGQKTFWARGYYVSTVGLNKNTTAVHMSAVVFLLCGRIFYYKKHMEIKNIAKMY